MLYTERDSRSQCIYFSTYVYALYALSAGIVYNMQCARDRVSSGNRGNVKDICFVSVLGIKVSSRIVVTNVSHPPVFQSNLGGLFSVDDSRIVYDYEIRNSFVGSGGRAVERWSCSIAVVVQ